MGPTPEAPCSSTVRSAPSCFWACSACHYLEHGTWTVLNLGVTYTF